MALCLFGTASAAALNMTAGHTSTVTPDHSDDAVAACYRRMDVVIAKCRPDDSLDFRAYDNVTEQWTLHPGLNCCCGGEGAETVPGPDPFPSGTSDPTHPWIPKQKITLDACRQGCSSDPLCTGIVTGKYEPPQPPPPPVTPDHCIGAPTQCSAEICDLQPGQISRLEPGTYYHNKQIFLPTGSAIIGAGINVTHIVACGPPLPSRCNLTERRGFLMGDDTYVGNFTFAGRESRRGGCSLGAGLIETPGCMGDYCYIPGKNTTGGRWGPGGDPSAHGDPLCNPPGRDMNQCVGITNATAEYIHLMPWTMDHVGWFPSTVPWGEDQMSGSKNITLRNLTTWGTWADGINFHGGHKNALVEDCEISYTGDDLYAVWPQATFRPGFNNTHDPRDCSDNIIFRNNIGRAPRNGFAGPDYFCSGGCKKWSGDPTGGSKSGIHKGIIQSTGTCFSLWGAGSNMAIIDNHCEETDVSVGFHPSYTNTRNLQMWCNAIAVDGNTYSNGGSCNTTGCQPNDDKTVCKTAGSWPTDGNGTHGPGTDGPGTIGEDLGCNRSALPSGYRQGLWSGFPSVAFPEAAAPSKFS